MTLLTHEPRLQGIGQLLILEKLLDKEEANLLYKLAVSENSTFVHYLVNNKILPAKTIALTAALKFGVPMMDLHCIDPSTIPIHLLNETLIRRHLMLPIIVHANNLYLATDDPSQHTSLKEIQFYTGLNTYSIVVETDKLLNLINQLLNPQIIPKNAVESTTSIYCTDSSAFFKRIDLSEEDTSVVDFVHQIICEAIRKKVSDIHFEPYETEYRIRYRQDGLLHEVATPPLYLAARICARIKIMSHLDISEKRLPQDGGFKMYAIDCRISTCPTIYGEKIVLRILDPSISKLDINVLGLNAAQQSLFINAMQRPQGMILVTGPTGSGKTLTLYSALNSLNKPDVNIVTVEDPVEIKIAGINQVSINSKIGLSFSNTLRAFLRQDPDIIMLGEIRDLESAEIAIMAAQTGHLVLATLHTNSAVDSIQRLAMMGIPNFNMIHSISLIIAQRLARVLCNECKVVQEDLTEQQVLNIGFSSEVTLYKAKGCSQCIGGYHGRIGLYELLPMNQELGALMITGASPIEMLQQAQRNGMSTMYQSGLEKVKQGITSLEEINRVTIDS